MHCSLKKESKINKNQGRGAISLTVRREPGGREGWLGYCLDEYEGPRQNILETRTREPSIHIQSKHLNRKYIWNLKYPLFSISYRILRLEKWPRLKYLSSWKPFEYLCLKEPSIFAQNSNGIIKSQPQPNELNFI